MAQLADSGAVSRWVRRHVVSQQSALAGRQRGEGQAAVKGGERLTADSLLRLTCSTLNLSFMVACEACGGTRNGIEGNLPGA